MKRYVTELANDVLRSISGPCNEFTDEDQRQEVTTAIRERITKALAYYKVGMLSAMEAVKAIIQVD